MKEKPPRVMSDVRPAGKGVAAGGNPVRTRVSEHGHSPVSAIRPLCHRVKAPPAVNAGLFEKPLVRQEG